MSKTSYALIGIMVAALIYMGAARFYEAWQRRAEATRQLQANDGEPFSFQHKPLSLAGPQVELMQDPTPYEPQVPPIYLEDAFPDADTQRRQAQATVSSVTQDFDADLQSFNADLQTATQGRVQNLADLSSQNLSQLVQENPQIVKVVQKHLNNREFAAKIDEIFSNPQFQQSVKELQHTPADLPQTPLVTFPVRRLAGSR